MYVKIKYLLISFLLVSAVYASKPLELKVGKYSVGGDASFRTRLKYTSVDLDFALNPVFSYIALPNWEFGGRLSFDIALRRAVPVANRVTWGLGVFTRRYFALKENLFYYFGGGASGYFLDFDKKSFKGYLKIENGLLIGITNNIGLDLGIPLIAQFNASNGLGYIEIPIGYFGIKAFI